MSEEEARPEKGGLPPFHMMREMQRFKKKMAYARPSRGFAWSTIFLTVAIVVIAVVYYFPATFRDEFLALSAPNREIMAMYCTNGLCRHLLTPLVFILLTLMDFLVWLLTSVSGVVRTQIAARVQP
jgi:hypothetical protein